MYVLKVGILTFDMRQGGSIEIGQTDSTNFPLRELPIHENKSMSHPIGERLPRCVPLLCCMITGRGSLY